ncbi:hypothetical protein XPA_004059 [Xanthoria parietina]
MSTPATGAKMPKVHQCSQEGCEKIFPRAYNLTRHVRAVHPRSQQLRQGGESTGHSTPDSAVSTELTTTLPVCLDRTPKPTSAGANANVAPPPVAPSRTATPISSGDMPSVISTPLPMSNNQTTPADPSTTLPPLSHQTMTPTPADPSTNLPLVSHQTTLIPAGPGIALPVSLDQATAAATNLFGTAHDENITSNYVFGVYSLLGATMSSVSTAFLRPTISLSATTCGMTWSAARICWDRAIQCGQAT